MMDGRVDYNLESLGSDFLSKCRQKVLLLKSLLIELI